MPGVAAYLVAGWRLRQRCRHRSRSAVGRPRPGVTACAATERWPGDRRASSVLLLSDLGRPAADPQHVPRVPAHVAHEHGQELLSATTGASLWALVLGNRGGALGVTGRVAGLTAGVVGVPLSGYTGVLLGATAVPGWNVGITTLPELFMASGTATSGSALRLLPVGEQGQRTVAAITVSAQVAELVAERLHERRLADRPRVRAAYEEQVAWRGGRALTIVSLALGVVSRRHPAVRVTAGVLGVAGAALTSRPCSAPASLPPRTPTPRMKGAEQRRPLQESRSEARPRCHPAGVTDGTLDRVVGGGWPGPSLAPWPRRPFRA